MNINQSKLNIKNNKAWFIIGAFTSAFLATICCLPALVFLFFGSSFAVLSFFQPLETIRWPLTIISIVFFALYIKTKFSNTNTCNFTFQKKKKNTAYVLSFVLLGFLLFNILFYPEILGKIYE